MSECLTERIESRIARIEKEYRDEYLDGGTEMDQAVRWRGTPHCLPVCPALEFHAAHGCNLGCDHCSHYSNYLDDGRVSASNAERMFETWHRKLCAPKLKVLGGEPLLNEELGEILRVARFYWPDSRIVLHTNGLLLNKHVELPDTLRTNRIHLAITWHSKEVPYLRRFEGVLDTVERWNIVFTVTPSINQWRSTTNGIGSAMRPWQSQPREAWEVCPAKYAVQLYENRLWKCPPIAYLRLVLDSYGLSELPEWAAFVKYKGLGPECTERELRGFLSQEHEAVCAMCSGEPAFVVKDIRKRHIP